MRDAREIILLFSLLKKYFKKLTHFFFTVREKKAPRLPRAPAHLCTSVQVGSNMDVAKKGGFGDEVRFAAGRRRH